MLHIPYSTVLGVTSHHGTDVVKFSIKSFSSDDISDVTCTIQYCVRGVMSHHGYDVALVAKFSIKSLRSDSNATSTVQFVLEVRRHIMELTDVVKFPMKSLCTYITCTCII
jgi:hypothetical protein